MSAADALKRRRKYGGRLGGGGRVQFKKTLGVSRTIIERPASTTNSGRMNKQMEQKDGNFNA